MSKEFPLTKTLGVLVFPGFELLDVFGPLEIFGNLPDEFNILLIAEKKGLIKSIQGPSVLAEAGFADNSSPIHLLLIPGGLGTREEVNNQNILNWIKKTSATAELTLTVCTGAALLARTGLLDKRSATSNKMAFPWVMQQGPQVNWIKQARWVDDGDIITSSGIAAGMDMSLYVIRRFHGQQKAQEVAHKMEYVWNPDPNNDTFFNTLNIDT